LVLSVERVLRFSFCGGELRRDQGPARRQWRTEVRRYESKVNGKGKPAATAARTRFAGPAATNSKANANSMATSTTPA
jgi:hypothetical protein